MFSFNFDVEDGGSTEATVVPASDASSAAATHEHPCVELELSDLIDSLPPFISYSTLTIPSLRSAPGFESSIWRRELYDARYQVLAGAEGSDDEEVEEGASTSQTKPKRKTVAEEAEAALSALDNPSDLVPGSYEGGLKTWECSLDLVSVLARRRSTETRTSIRGQTVLELGCGTAVPTTWLFQELCRECATSGARDDPKETLVVCQDYNAEVIRLLTLPNLLLAWVRTSRSDASPDAAPDDDSDIELTPELITSFRDFLGRHRISLRFFAGGWSTFPLRSSNFDLILTSETIYSTSSLPPLVDLLQKCPAPGADVFVAAKTVYFGVGGGEVEFRKEVEARGGRLESVWSTSDGTSRTDGVGRVVLRATWP